MIISLPWLSYSTTSLNFRFYKVAALALHVVALSMNADVDVVGPPILNPERLGVDDVEGTNEELLYRLLWGKEGWNWWGGGGIKNVFGSEIFALGGGIIFIVAS